MGWLPKHRVVVPFDFSETAKAAIETALQLVDSPERVDVIYVLRTPHAAEPGVLWDGGQERQEKAQAALAEHLKDAGLERVAAKVRTGDPGHEIVDAAEACNADLIVIPSHGRRGVSRLLLGSVAERVVRLAKCPVLVLRCTE